MFLKTFPYQGFDSQMSRFDSVSCYSMKDHTQIASGLFSNICNICKRCTVGCAEANAINKSYTLF